MNGFKFAESSISIHVLDMILQKLTHIFITREEKYDKVPNLEKGHSEPFSTITLKYTGKKNTGKYNKIC